MKYIKYDADKKVYIISEHVNCKSELDAHWKEDVGIPTTELDTDSIIKIIEETGQDTNILSQHSFVVLHHGNKYIVSFKFSLDYQVGYSVFDKYLNNLFHLTERNIKNCPYLITDEDLDIWEKSRKQIAENFGLPDGTTIDISTF